jgi:predicted NBD/HSP70 family sugar kinase
VQFADVQSADEVLLAPPLRQVEIPTPHDEGEYIAKITATIQQNFPEFNKSPEENVVILATLGNIQKGLVTTERLGWQDFPVAKVLRQNLRVNQVLLENDAKIGTLGAFGAGFSGRGMYVTLGSGIGVGLIIDGKLSGELSSMEAGHMLLKQTDGSLVEWENFASGVAFSQKYERHGDKIPKGDIIWREYTDNLSAGLYVLLPTLRPDCVMFGGEISRYFDKFGSIIADNLRAIDLNKKYFDVPVSAVADPHYTVNRGALLFGLLQMGLLDEN